MNFKRKQQIDKHEDFQYMKLTEFSFEGDFSSTNQKVVDTFIRSSYFAHEIPGDNVNQDPKINYLAGPFIIDKLKITDFEVHRKDGVIKFLIDFINIPTWGDDRNDFAKLLDKYFEILDKLEDNEFYIISKNWFKVDDYRLIEANWIYGYYFLIIAVDRKLNSLTLTEWIYD